MTNDADEAKAAGEGMRQAVREQIESGEPAEAKLTWERLRALGMRDDEALEFMAAAFTAEVFEMLRDESGFDMKRYEGRLRELPKLPWE